MAFPTSPVVGQVFTTTLGMKYVWTADGAWRGLYGEGSNAVEITLPPNAAGYLKNDGMGILSWDAGTGGGGGSTIAVTEATSPPSSPSSGYMWFDTTAVTGGRWYLYSENESAWIEIT